VDPNCLQDKDEDKISKSSQILENFVELNFDDLNLKVENFDS
jgi:hypothetical protein